jgi:hypothetical protein
MAIIEGWLPPTREHWELISYTFQFFPLVIYYKNQYFVLILMDCRSLLYNGLWIGTEWAKHP